MIFNYFLKQIKFISILFFILSGLVIFDYYKKKLIKKYAFVLVESMKINMLENLYYIIKDMGLIKYLFMIITMKLMKN